MSFAAFVTRRFVFSVFAAFLVVSLTFGVVALTPDPNLGGKIAEMQRSGATQEEIEAFKQQYREENGLAGSLGERYVGWMTNVATFDWGEASSMNDKPVTDVVGDRLPYTLAYVVPAFFLSLVGGVAVGLFGALGRNSVRDRATRLAAYAAMGIPAFWLVNFLDATYGFSWFRAPAVVLAASVRIGDAWAFSHPLRYLAPALVLSLGLLAGLLQHARAEALEHVNADFVTLVRAKGGGQLTAARHVLRNAAIPIASMSLSEVVAVLVLNVYLVETVFIIPGLGSLSLHAIAERDMALILGTTMVLVFVGIAGNFLQDLLYGYLDPRVREGETA